MHVFQIQHSNAGRGSKAGYNEDSCRFGSHCRSWRASFYDPDRRRNASKASSRIASTYLDGMSRFAKASLGRWVSPLCLACRDTAATVMSPTHQDPWCHSDFTERGTALSLEQTFNGSSLARPFPRLAHWASTAGNPCHSKFSADALTPSSERPLAIQLLEQPRKV